MGGANGINSVGYRQMTENELTDAIIGAAIEVHRRLGPGLLESVYRRCLAHELRKRGFSVVEEKPVALDYDDLHDPCAFRADLLVEELIVVELKAKSAISPIDKAQTLSHLRLMNLNVGLLLNFHEAKLVDGLHRIVNNYLGPRVSE
ncbi:MAG: GxxExxY protein [bacterium]|nr:GxxExxY protein [bacterium]